MNVSLPKLKAAILYFADYDGMKYLGKVKLMKLLYFLDFQHVKNHGTPVLNDQYYHLEKGPIPTVTLNMVNELIAEPETARLADTIEIQIPPHTNMHKVVPAREFSDNDSKVFSETEFETLEKTAERFADVDTSTIVEISHKEAPWRLTEYTERIPYELASYDPDSKFDKEELIFLNSL